MGLLDFLNSDDAQLGLNMLAAGGPSTTRMSAGQRMAGAVTATNAAKSAQSDAALKKAQLAEALQKTEVEKFGLQRLQDWQKITMGDGTPAMAPAGMSSVPQSGDTSGGLIGSLQGNVAPQGAPQAQAMPSAQGQPAMSSAVPQASSGAFRFGLPGIPDGNSRAIAASMTPSDYLKLYAEKAMPQTDIGKLMAAQGIDPKSALGQQLLQTATAKANYVAPSNIRPGGYTQDITGNVQQFPHVPDGSTAFKDANGQFHIVPVDGGTGAISLAKQAETMGVGEATPTVVYGPGGAPDFSTRATDVRRAGQPQQQSMPQPQPGMTSSFSGPPADMQRLIAGIKDPQERANAGDAYARQMGGGGAAPMSASGYPTTPIGGVTPQPMPGIVSNANVANEASAKTMHDSYARLQASNSASNSALDGINKMQGLAANKNPFLQSGPLMAGPMRTLQTSVSTDAAEYEKQRANLISMLAAQNGTNGTDAGRALTGDSVPDFGKPKDAIKDGLNTLKNQTTVQQIKSQFLTPSYQSGDSKTYTQKEGEFDRNISPSMISLLTMPAGQSRALLLQSAAKDPAMRARLEWAMQNGMLK